MSSVVKKDAHVIDMDTRGIISSRYKRITKSINQTFWGSNSETAHSYYVGSYGRGTAINTSDLMFYLNCQRVNITILLICMEMGNQGCYKQLKMQFL